MRARFILAAAAAGLSSVAAAYEEPEFVVVRQYDGFELRRYVPYVVVETDASGEFEEGRNRAFRRLFKYISGENVSQEKVAMTTPVTTARSDDSSGEKIAMTVPVTTQPQGSRRVMRFVLPETYSLGTAPRPLDPAVRLQAVGSELVAARRYSGRPTEAGYREQERQLLERVRAAGLEVVSAPLFAVYNGPFTPWFMRRNEVLVRVAREAG